MLNDQSQFETNPLRRWRLSQSDVPSLTDMARRAGVSVPCWRSWECWPRGEGKMPSANNWVVIHRLTGVSSNDFIALIEEAV